MRGRIIVSILRRTSGGVLALTLAGSAAAVIASAVPASADAGGNPSLQYCRSIAAFYPGINITGPCTSYFQSHDFAGVAATNALFCRTVFVPIGEFVTVGECVTTLDQQLGG
jgi:hypothetical protein